MLIVTRRIREPSSRSPTASVCVPAVKNHGGELGEIELKLHRGCSGKCVASVTRERMLSAYVQNESANESARVIRRWGQLAVVIPRIRPWTRRP